MNKELSLIDSNVGEVRQRRVKRCRCNSDGPSWDQLQNVVTVRDGWEVRVGTEGPHCGWFSHLRDTESDTCPHQRLINQRTCPTFTDEAAVQLPPAKIRLPPLLIVSRLSMLLSETSGFCV